MLSPVLASRLLATELRGDARDNGWALHQADHCDEQGGECKRTQFECRAPWRARRHNRVHPCRRKTSEAKDWDSTFGAPLLSHRSCCTPDTRVPRGGATC